MSFKLNFQSSVHAFGPAVTGSAANVSLARWGVASPRSVTSRLASRAGGGGPPSRQQPPYRQQPYPPQPYPLQPCALIVEDDPEVWGALAAHLGPELHVHLAATVARAEVLLRQLERVDLAFVGLELPDGSGERILERLTRWPDAIRVLLSGTGRCDEDTLKNRALANIVLRKPVLPRAIEALKRAALALPNG